MLFLVIFFLLLLDFFFLFRFGEFFFFKKEKWLKIIMREEENTAAYGHQGQWQCVVFLSSSEREREIVAWRCGGVIIENICWHNFIINFYLSFVQGAPFTLFSFLHLHFIYFFFCQKSRLWYRNTHFYCTYMIIIIKHFWGRWKNFENKKKSK